MSHRPVKTGFIQKGSFQIDDGISSETATFLCLIHDCWALEEKL